MADAPSPTDVRKRQPTTAAELLAALESFDWAAWREQLRGFYVPLARDLVETRAGQVADRFTFADPYASEVMTRYVGERIVQLDETTRTQLRALLQREFAAWQAEGTTFDLGSKVRDAVRERYAGYQRWRADRIARTESAIVSNIGAALGAKAAGYTHVRVFDGDEDEECAAVNNTVQTVEWLLENPVAHPNCVRSAAPVVPEAGSGQASDGLEPMGGRGGQRARRQDERSPRGHAYGGLTRESERLSGRVDTLDLTGFDGEEREHIAGILNAALDESEVLQRALREVFVFDDQMGDMARGGKGRIGLNVAAISKLQAVARRTAADVLMMQADTVRYYDRLIAALDVKLAALKPGQRKAAQALRAERDRLEFNRELRAVATREYTYEDAADKIAAVLHHELGHVLKHAIELERATYWSGPDGVLHRFQPAARADVARGIGRISGYAGETHSELFAELHTLLSTGRGHEVPDWLARAYRAYTEPQANKGLMKTTPRAYSGDAIPWGGAYGPVSETDRRTAYANGHRPWSCADMFRSPPDDPSFADWVRRVLVHVDEAHAAGERIPPYVTEAVPRLKEMLARFETADPR